MGVVKAEMEQFHNLLHPDMEVGEAQSEHTLQQFHFLSVKFHTDSYLVSGVLPQSISNHLANLHGYRVQLYHKSAILWGVLKFRLAQRMHSENNVAIYFITPICIWCLAKSS